jgi:N-acyl-D-aspartate/D-glutamate deacylase
MLELIIKGGTVVDGTGRQGFKADMGIRSGRIVAVGTVEEPAAKAINVEGLVVAPGFIDVHTHYDAQVFWDPSLSPSPLHGVTTAIGGNCGFTIAPISDEHSDYLARMLALVEGMPLESLRKGVPWGTWTTFGQWLKTFEGKLAINAGFMVGHSTIRRLAMGEDAHNPHPSEAQLRSMETYLRESLQSGAVGFSSSNGRNHLDGDQNPVPSRCAPDEEFVRLASVVSEFPGTSLEYIPRSGAASDEARMIAMSKAAQRPINWNVLVVTAARASAVETDLAVSDRAAVDGARIIALENPARKMSRRSFATSFGFNTIPNWGPVFALPLAERVQALEDVDVRRRLRAGLTEAPERFPGMLDFAGYTVEMTPSAANAGLAGRLVKDIAQERGADWFDTLLDIVIADDFRTTVTREMGSDQASLTLQAQVWRDQRVVLGASDAGAHLDMLTGFVYTTDLLGYSVRDRQLLTTEEAVRLITDVPARLYGLQYRGRVEVGGFADLVVFDPDTVGPDSVVTREDLPGGASRLYAKALGVEHVFVNGTEIVRTGEYTGDRPGQVLRSGIDTGGVHV